MDSVLFEFYQLVEKTYPRVHSFVKNKKGTINLERDILPTYLKNIFIASSDDEFNGTILATIIFAKIYDKEIEETELLSRFFDNLIQREYSYEDTQKWLKENKNVKSKDKKMVKAHELLERLQEYWGGVPLINEWCVYRINNNCAEDPHGFTESLAFVYDLEGLSSASLLDEIKLNKTDILELAAIYYERNKNLNRENASTFMISAIMLRSILRAYHNAKEYYFKNNKETMYLELDTKDVEIKELKTKLEAKDDELKSLRNEVNRLKSEYKNSLEKEIISQSKQIDDYKNEITVLKENQKELIALREYVFNGSQEENIDHTEEQELVVPSIRGLVIGGHPRWQGQIKSMLPNTFSFIAHDAMNFDPALIVNSDKVFINASYLSHAMYYKVIANLPADINLHYISGGPARSVQDIARTTSC